MAPDPCLVFSLTVDRKHDFFLTCTHLWQGRLSPWFIGLHVQDHCGHVSSASTSTVLWSKLLRLSHSGRLDKTRCCYYQNIHTTYTWVSCSNNTRGCSRPRRGEGKCSQHFLSALCMQALPPELYIVVCNLISVRFF